jgi:hypothetical protein
MMDYLQLHNTIDKRSNRNAEMELLLRRVNGEPISSLLGERHGARSQRNDVECIDKIVLLVVKQLALLDPQPTTERR